MSWKEKMGWVLLWVILCEGATLGVELAHRTATL